MTDPSTLDARDEPSPLIDPSYSEAQAYADRLSIGSAASALADVMEQGSGKPSGLDQCHAEAWGREAVRIAERLMVERDRLLSLLASERIGRPAATVDSVLDLVTVRMAEFAAGDPDRYYDMNPTQALQAIVGGIRGELHPGQLEFQPSQHAPLPDRWATTGTDASATVKVSAARSALSAEPTLGELRWWDPASMRELLIQAACPPVCVGHRQIDGPDWHAWCERKADAALAVLTATRPPAFEASSGPTGAEVEAAAFTMFGRPAADLAAADREAAVTMATEMLTAALPLVTVRVLAAAAASIRQAAVEQGRNYGSTRGRYLEGCLAGMQDAARVLDSMPPRSAT